VLIFQLPSLDNKWEQQYQSQAPGNAGLPPVALTG